MSQTVLYVLAGMFIYACMNNFIFGLRTPENRTRLLLAVLSALAAVFALFETSMYYAGTLNEYLVAHKNGLNTALVFLIVLPWFAQWYLPVFRRNMIIAFNLIFSVLFMASVFSAPGLYFTELAGFGTRLLPWGESIHYVAADMSVFGEFIWLTMLTLSAFLLYGCIRQYQTALRQKAIYLSTSLGLLVSLASVDYLIDSQYIEFMRVGIFGVLAMIMSMSFAFSFSASRNITQLASKETDLRLALNAANIVTWDMDIKSGNTNWSDGINHITGLTPGGPGESFESYLALLNPAEALQVKKAVQQSVEDDVPCYVEHRIFWPDNSEHWIVCEGEVTRGSQGVPERMRGTLMDITSRKRIEQTIGDIAAGVSADPDDAFFRQLVLHLAKLFDADYALIGTLSDGDAGKVETIAVAAEGKITDNLCYSLAGTPCEKVLNKDECAYPENVQGLFPTDKLLVEMGAQSYIGTPLLDTNGEVMGLLVVLDRKPLVNIEYITEALRIFAIRASAELARRQSEKQLRKAEQRLRLHVNQTPLGVIEWDTSFCVTDWNESAEKIFGYTRKEAIGVTARELILKDESIQKAEEIWDSLLESKGGMRSTFRNTTKSGGLITCEWYNTPLVTDDDERIGIASLVQDISDRVYVQEELANHKNRLEEQVLKRTKELETANKELESFSYSVSHDLRTPLRSINGFSQALLDDYSNLLDETGRDYLGRLVNASERMAALIDDLLELSRLGRSEMKNEKVNLSNLAADAIQKLREEYPQRDVVSIIEPDVNVSGDTRLLGVVIDNLIENAWKYTGKRDSAKIEFGTFEKEKATVYFVKDDGAGFDMRYIKKLFGAFQRLHHADDFEGTGIGLATVQRLVHRHGGTVWATGEVDKGATIYFTLASANA